MNIDLFSEATSRAVIKRHYLVVNNDDGGIDISQAPEIRFINDKVNNIIKAVSKYPFKAGPDRLTIANQPDAPQLPDYEVNGRKGQWYVDE